MCLFLLAHCKTFLCSVLFDHLIVKRNMILTDFIDITYKGAHVGLPSSLPSHNMNFCGLFSFVENLAVRNALINMKFINQR